MFSKYNGIVNKLNSLCISKQSLHIFKKTFKLIYNIQRLTQNNLAIYHSPFSVQSLGNKIYVNIEAVLSRYVNLEK